MKVIEIFDSIDGEGIRTGQCATFIRLAGCNLRCSYCDTVYSLFGEETPCEYTEMTVDEIAEVFECSRGTVLSRLNYSRAKMKTAIEDYENKSGDKLHGVVVVPFFTTIFKEEAKSLVVPNITIKLPNGQTLATSATKGFATGAKSTVSSIVKATATATVKTKVIAVVCGATILAGTSAVGISILAGCNAEKEPTEPSVISSTVQTSTVPTTVPIVRFLPFAVRTAACPWRTCWTRHAMNWNGC